MFFHCSCFIFLSPLQVCLCSSCIGVQEIICHEGSVFIHIGPPTLSMLQSVTQLLSTVIHISLCYCITVLLIVFFISMNRWCPFTSGGCNCICIHLIFPKGFQLIYILHCTFHWLTFSPWLSRERWIHMDATNITSLQTCLLFSTSLIICFIYAL